MKMLFMAGLLVLSACGKQEEKNYYTAPVHVIETATPEEVPEGENYVYGRTVEPISKPYEFNFEIKTFNYKKALPQGTEAEFFKVFEARNIELKYFNHQIYEKGTRELTIHGKNIILNAEDAQGILALINDALDLSKLTIEADTLTVETGVNLPQTNLTIHARELFFTRAGFINTTPKSLTFPAEQFMDGLPGLNAGNIELNVLALNYEKGEREVDMLIANGGDGQRAGAGKNGARGFDAHIVELPNFRSYETPLCDRSISRAGTGAATNKSRSKQGRHAGNGQDATPGGAPGVGGQAGEILLNADHIVSVSQKGGISGQPAVITFGGEPGQPATTCKLHVSCKGYKKVYECVTAVKGKDVESPMPKVVVQPFKREQIRPKAWLTDSILNYNIKFMEELYFRGHIETAILEKYKIESYLNTEKDLSPNAMLAKNKLQALEYQMASRLDFYGNPAGWTPSFNFNLNFRAFKSEVERSLKTLFYTELLRTKLEANDSIVQTSKSFQAELIADAKNSEDKLSELITSTTKFVESLDELAVARNEFNFELKKVEEKIREMAQGNLAEPFMSKAVKVFAAASKVIPVAQPALALVGQGVEMVHRMAQSKDPVSIMLNEVPDFLGNVSKVDFKAAGDQLNQKLSDISITKLGEFSKAPENETSEQRINRLKNDFNSKKELIGDMIDFYKPIVNSVKEQTEMMRAREVSKSALEQEIEKIKSKHKMFNRVSKLLETVHIKQEETNLLLQKTQTQISVNFQKIAENLLLVSDLYTELGSASKIQSHKLHSLLDNFSERATNNLKFYHYKLAKSYEYKNLIPYRGELDLAQIFSATMDLISSGQDHPSGSDIDYMMLAYENELSKVTSQTFNSFERGNRNLSIRKKVFLSKDEIKVLNTEKVVYLDLSSSEDFGVHRENVRLENIQITPKATGNYGDLEIMVEHDKKSVIRRGMNNYVFSHTDDNLNQHLWITSLNLPTNTLSMSETSKEDFRTLEAILGSNLKIDKLYANPSARGFYKVSLSKSEAEIVLDELEIEFEITFQHK